MELLILSFVILQKVLRRLIFNFCVAMAKAFASLDSCRSDYGTMVMQFYFLLNVIYHRLASDLERICDVTISHGEYKASFKQRVTDLAAW